MANKNKIIQSLMLGVAGAMSLGISSIEAQAIENNTPANEENSTENSIATMTVEEVENNYDEVIQNITPEESPLSTDIHTEDGITTRVDNYSGNETITTTVEGNQLEDNYSETITASTEEKQENTETTSEAVYEDGVSSDGTVTYATENKNEYDIKKEELENKIPSNAIITKVDNDDNITYIWTDENNLNHVLTENTTKETNSNVSSSINKEIIEDAEDLGSGENIEITTDEDGNTTTKIIRDSASKNETTVTITTERTTDINKIVTTIEETITGIVDKTISVEEYNNLQDKSSYIWKANLDSEGNIISYSAYNAAACDALDLGLSGSSLTPAAIDEKIKSLYPAESGWTVSRQDNTWYITKTDSDNCTTLYTYTYNEEVINNSTNNVIQDVVESSTVEAEAPSININNYEKYTIITSEDASLNCHENGGVYAGGQITNNGWIDSWGNADIYDADGKVNNVTNRVNIKTSEDSSTVSTYWNEIADKISNKSSSAITQVNNTIVANYDVWKGNSSNSFWDFINYLHNNNLIKTGNNEGYQPGQDAQGESQYSKSHLLIVTLSNEVLQIKNWMGNLELGTLIAPNAQVSVDGNNINGTIISKSINSYAESHINKVSNEGTSTKKASYTSSGVTESKVQETINKTIKSAIGYIETTSKEKVTKVTETGATFKIATEEHVNVIPPETPPEEFPPITPPEIIPNPPYTPPTEITPATSEVSDSEEEQIVEGQVLGVRRTNNNSQAVLGARRSPQTGDTNSMAVAAMYISASLLTLGMWSLNRKKKL